MERRDVLRGVGALSTGLVVGTSRGRAHETGGDGGTVRGTPDDRYEPLGVVDVPGAREAVVGTDSMVYVATGDGYAVVDVTDPAAPRVVTRQTEVQPTGAEEPLVDVQDLAVEGTTLVVAGPAHPRRTGPAGVAVVDVSDPADPRTRGFFPTTYPVHNCDLSDGRAYLTANDGDRNGLVVVDVSDPDRPRELGSWSILDVDDAWADVPTGRWTLHDVVVEGGVAVCAHWDAGTWLVDVADPTEMRVVGRVDAPDPSQLPTDLPDPSVTPPGNHHYAALDGTGTLLVVGAETFGVGVDDDGDGTDDRVVGGPSGVDLWDVSDTSAPRKLSTIHPPRSDDATFGGTWTTAHNFHLAGDTLYTAWYQGGVKRHDVSDPSTPREESWWLAPEVASFWTARAVVTGSDGFFVAPSRGVDDVPGRLYTFPDRPGVHPTSPDDAVHASGQSSTTRTPTGTPLDDSDRSGVSAPGFGAASTAAALGGGLWWLWRRTR